MNEQTVHYLNIFLGTGAIALQVIAALALIMLFFGPKKNGFLAFIDKNFLALGFFISLTGSLFSLVYSEVIGYLPCYLCWFQRAFLYPAVFIFGIALWHNDRGILKYVMPILSIGGVIALYQSFYYYFGDGSALPCDASGVSCYQALVSEFGGYISIPMLALTSFASILVFCLVAHFYGRRD